MSAQTKGGSRRRTPLTRGRVLQIAVRQADKGGIDSLSMTTRNVLTGERGPRPGPFTLDPEGASVSLAKLEAVQATWVLPGHGPPWQGGVAEAIRQVRQVTTGS